MYEKSYFLHLSLKEARNLLGLQAKHLGMCSDETDVQESYRELDNSY